jgi:hypothetical protein
LLLTKFAAVDILLIVILLLSIHAVVIRTQPGIRE